MKGRSFLKFIQEKKMDKGRVMILKATMVLFILVSLFLGLIVYKVYESFNGSYFDKLKVSDVARKYIETVYPDLNLEIKEIDYNYKRNTFSVFVYSKTSEDTYFDIYLDLTKRVERDSYNLVEDGTTTFWRLSFGYEAVVREAIESEYRRTLAFCSAELKSDYLEKDYNHVVIKKGLERDKQYDIMEFGKRAGYIEVCYSEPVVSEHRLAELFLETKALLKRERIPFYKLGIILQDSKNLKKRYASGILSSTFTYDEINEDIFSKISEFNRLRRLWDE